MHQTIDRLTEQFTPHVQQGACEAGELLALRSDQLRSDQLRSNQLRSNQLRSNQLREISDEWAASLRTTVCDHPLASGVGGVGIGLLPR